MTRKGRREESGWLALLEEILLDADKLTSAACAGRHELFDDPPPDEDPADTARRTTAAARLCATCPVRRHCPHSVIQSYGRTA